MGFITPASVYVLDSEEECHQTPTTSTRDGREYFILLTVMIALLL